jgi:hypothetical protein
MLIIFLKGEADVHEYNIPLKQKKRKVNNEAIMQFQLQYLKAVNFVI